MPRLLRFTKIISIALRYRLDELVVPNLPHGGLRWFVKGLRLFRQAAERPAPRGERLRKALEELGPIFVKFGQVLSTRRDLMPPDIADELAKLQDRVPPFDSTLSAQLIEQALGMPLSQMFATFERDPIASASIAQVHFATLKANSNHPDWEGREVAVKVLRPNMLPVIESDLALMRQLAEWVERISVDGRRLKPREVVAEFDKYLHDELDLMREAANASQLRRNFADGTLLHVPQVYWDGCRTTVMVMERMHGLPISHLEQLDAAGVDRKKLARDGVEIFFTQVFRDGFFHADMHPGNILVSTAPASLGRYIALDFGIIGTLSDFDKNYLAQNFLAFFNRDYHRVAALHLESGWVPPETRVEELEGAVRAVCEPYFARPLKDISLGLVLLRLFQVSRRFKVEIQPQLVLLQKTLLNVEGLGRQLDPDLDLWQTAKPFLEKWVSRQLGPRGLIDKLKAEAPQWAQLLPQLPRLLHQSLSQYERATPQKNPSATLEALLAEQRRTNRMLAGLLWFVGGIAAGVLISYLWMWWTAIELP